MAQNGSYCACLVIVVYIRPHLGQRNTASGTLPSLARPHSIVLCGCDAVTLRQFDNTFAVEACLAKLAAISGNTATVDAFQAIFTWRF